MCNRPEYGFVIIITIILMSATISTGGGRDRIVLGISKSKYYALRGGIGFVSNESSFLRDLGKFWGFSMVADVNFNEKGVNSAGAMVNASSSSGILAGKINLGVYKGIKYNWLVTITPEIGLSALEYLGVYYGYDINVVRPSDYLSTSHRISCLVSFEVD